MHFMNQETACGQARKGELNIRIFIDKEVSPPSLLQHFTTSFSLLQNVYVISPRVWIFTFWNSVLVSGIPHTCLLSPQTPVRDNTDVLSLSRHSQGQQWEAETKGLGLLKVELRPDSVWTVLKRMKSQTNIWWWGERCASQERGVTSSEIWSQQLKAAGEEGMNLAQMQTILSRKGCCDQAQEGGLEWAGKERAWEMSREHDTQSSQESWVRSIPLGQSLLQ